MKTRAMTLVEVVIAVAILAVGVLGILSVLNTSSLQSQLTRELELARNGAAKAREGLRTVRFRRLSATDTQQTLFNGGYEIARTDPTALDPQGTNFTMPNLNAATLVTEDGIQQCVRVEFPVPPLKPVPGRTQAGRVIFLAVREAGQTVAGTIPNARFPFPPTPGFTFLDCDGDGVQGTSGSTATDLRNRHSQAGTPAGTNALRLMPVKIVVEWLSRGRSVNRYDEFVLLSYQGYE